MTDAPEFQPLPLPPPPPPEAPPFALVRHGHVTMTGPKDILEQYCVDRDEVLPFEASDKPGLHINFVDRKTGTVKQISRHAVATAEQRRAIAAASRATAYPFVCDQIAAVLKQLDLMTKGGERHPEFQAVLDQVAAVKERLA